MDIYDTWIGPSPVTAHQIDTLLLSVNPSSPRVGGDYVSLGKRFGLKAHFAVAQMIWETDWLRFTGSVKVESHNMAGMKGIDGRWLAFPGWYEGIHAHYERLAQYAFGSCPNTECGQDDPSYSDKHWQYQRLIATRGRADRVVDIGSLWCASDTPESYAGHLVGLAERLLEVPDDGSLPSGGMDSHSWITPKSAPVLLLAGAVASGFVMAGMVAMLRPKKKIGK